MRIYSVIDAETTGKADDAQLMELARCPVALNAERQVWIGEPYSRLFRPTCEIEPGARAAHHITAAMVADRFPATTDDRVNFATEPVFGVAPAVWVAHNVDYEARWFTKELIPIPRLCTYKAALRLFPEAPSFSNGALYYWLQDQGLMPDLGEAAHPMHRAGPDTLITANILALCLQRATTAQLLQWTDEPRLMPVCPIGDDWKGKKWSLLDFKALTWIATKKGMDPDTAWNAQQEINKRAANRSPQ